MLLGCVELQNDIVIPSSKSIEIMLEIAINPIGYITTPFKQKFGIPRQPNLANAKGTIELTSIFQDSAVFKGIEGFSHVWLLFQFDKTQAAGWKPTVKAPRLGGNATLGVFASRSNFRPNGIGMSVVTLDRCYAHDGKLCLAVSGVDLLDNTPILDIKPYLPYADNIEQAHTPFDDEQRSAKPQPHLSVTFTPAAEQQLAIFSKQWPDLAQLIEQVLSQDPRPAYKAKKTVDDKRYACQLYDVDVAWRVIGQKVVVEALTLVAS